MVRPRKHPQGTTPSDIARLSTERFLAAGGARKTFNLSADSIKNLAAIRAAHGDRTDTAAIERLLDEAASKLSRR